MAEKAVRNKRKADEAAALAGPLSSPRNRDSTCDIPGPSDPTYSPGPGNAGEAGSSSATKQKKKKDGDKSRNPVVHQDYLERQLQIFQDQLISKLSMAFIQPTPQAMPDPQGPSLQPQVPPAPSPASPVGLLQLVPGPSGATQPRHRPQAPPPVSPQRIARPRSRGLSLPQVNQVTRVLNHPSTGNNPSRCQWIRGRTQRAELCLQLN